MRDYGGSNPDGGSVTNGDEMRARRFYYRVIAYPDVLPDRDAALPGKSQSLSPCNVRDRTFHQSHVRHLVSGDTVSPFARCPGKYSDNGWPHHFPPNPDQGWWQVPEPSAPFALQS